MSDNQEKSNELPEIIDVDFLPILDDEDYKKEKTHQTQELDTSLVDMNRFTHSQTETVDQELNQTDEIKDTQETIKDIHQNTKQDTKQDTSYASYDQSKKQEFRKKKKRVGRFILKSIGIIIAILIGLPIIFGVGVTAVSIIGVGIFLSIMALGMGVLGLGMAGFTAAAGMAPMELLFLFASLVSLGIGGLGSCIICFIFISIKNLIVGINKRRKIRKESQEV